MEAIHCGLELTCGACAQLDHVSVHVPEDRGLYDIQTEVPSLTYPSSRGLEALAHLGPGGVEAILQEVLTLERTLRRLC